MARGSVGFVRCALLSEPYDQAGSVRQRTAANSGSNAAFHPQFLAMFFDHQKKNFAGNGSQKTRLGETVCNGKPDEIQSLH
jgi:hypothetical protein